MPIHVDSWQVGWRADASELNSATTDPQALGIAVSESSLRREGSAVHTARCVVFVCASSPQYEGLVLQLEIAAPDRGRELAGFRGNGSFVKCE
jgi:hypothetical protein